MSFGAWLFCLSFDTKSHYVGQTVPKVSILLPQHPKLWDYR
jgi:hypothetical protein